MHCKSVEAFLPTSQASDWRQADGPARLLRVSLTFDDSEPVFQLLCFSTARSEAERINPLNQGRVPTWGAPSTQPQFEQAGPFRTMRKQNWLFGSWANKNPDYSANSAVFCEPQFWLSGPLSITLICYKAKLPCSLN